MKKTIILNLVLLLAVSAFAPAAIHMVPSEYATIQEAIDDCSNGDAIIIAPGRYTGPGNRDIDFKGKAITVRSTDPNDPNIVAATIIDCNGIETNPHRGFIFHRSEGPNSVIAGLTIAKGFASRLSPCESSCSGGGIFCLGSPTITNCIFIKNSAGGSPNAEGGAIYSSGGNPTVTNCTFKSNSVIGSSLTRGGAIYSLGNPTPIRRDPIITNCVFTENSVGGGLISFGGALYNENSALTLTNCTFTYNWAGSDGGGIYNKNSPAILAGCTFNGNEAIISGGGMFNYNGQITLSHCAFADNLAYWGGGICNDERSTMTLTDCDFVRNLAASGGGGIHNFDYINQTLVNCTFIGNIANYEGAAIANWYGNALTLFNCRFTGNFTPYYGGGIYSLYLSGLKLVNCTFADNFALNGNALACSSYGDYSQVSIINSIFWDGGNEISIPATSKITVTHSNVQGGWQGEGNINTDPCFVDAGLWANINDLNTPADPTGPDAIWVDGDYHLKSRAGHWDTTTESWIKDLLASPCIDAGDPTSPVGLEPFPNGGIINVGSFGGTKEASKSYFGEPLCQIIVAGDINGDCKVNFIDFAFISFHWLENNKGRTWPSPWPPYPPPPKGRTCFPADTPVWVDGSLVQISKVVADQIVGKTNCLAASFEEIESVQEHRGSFQCRDIMLENGNTISVVDSHCFLLDSSQWIAAQDLKPGLKLKSLNGPVGIRSVKMRPAPFVGKVYNLKIRNCDQYFVGNDGIFVRDY
jgi:hypothetical protein